jgi:hypothetical protein
MEAPLSYEATRKLILVPAVITLAVTLLRLVGELQGWSPLLFNKEAGGGAAIVGIAWLVPVFGAWFGWTLTRAGSGPGGIGRALGLTVLAFALIPAVGFLAAKAGIEQQSLTTLWIYAVASIGSVVVGMRAWPALGRTLFGYGLAARIPVVLVMLAAMLGNWGTHYDVAPSADFPQMGTLAKWFTIGVVPQLTIWMAFTIVIGGLFGIVAGAIARRKTAAA